MTGEAGHEPSVAEGNVVDLARRSPAIRELELRCEIARCFADRDEDEDAFRRIASMIRGAIGATRCVVVYTDGKGERKQASDGATIGEASRRDGRLESVFGAGGTAEGLLAVESEGGEYSLEAISLFGAALAEIERLVPARQSKARLETSRHEADKALRRSEERLRTFFEESRDMIYTANGDDVVASINQAGLSLLGLRDRFEIIGHPFSLFLYHADDRSIVLKRLAQVGYTEDFEVIMKKADGSTLFCIETAQAVKDRTGRILEVQGIVRDISERMRTERRLLQTNVELSELNARLNETQMLMVQQEKLASIGQLAAGIAHEINNPLGFLRSNHATLAQFTSSLKAAWVEAAGSDRGIHEEIAARHDLDYVFQELGALLAESDEGYRRIMEIVQNLKDFARIDRKAPFGPYDLERGIANCLIVSRNKLKYVAEVEYIRGGVPIFNALGNEVNQVLLNLLVNAGQAIAGQGRKGMGRIRIETSARRGMAVCEISDDGPGVPEELRHKIFDPFFTTKAPGEGTGLGLSISYDIIVNKHGGRLLVDGSDLGGARFTIELPLKDDGSNPEIRVAP